MQNIKLKIHLPLIECSEAETRNRTKVDLVLNFARFSGTQIAFNQALVTGNYIENENITMNKANKGNILKITPSLQLFLQAFFFKNFVLI